MTEGTPPEDLRLTFDNVPEIYDRARPAYPEALFVDLFAYLRESLRIEQPNVIEIGPATGQATRSLLAHGASVTAVEIGPRLAAFLRAKFAAEQRLEVINASFEDASLRSGAYDLVVSASAYHWIGPAVRVSKSHDVLRPGGALAIIGANQIASEVDRGFFEHVFPIYVNHRPDEQRTELQGEDIVPPEYEEIRTSALFADVTLFRYRWDQTYTSAAYADLVRSYSNSQAMAPPAREALIADLCTVIDAKYHGLVTRPLVVTLTLGRKRTS